MFILESGGNIKTKLKLIDVFAILVSSSAQRKLKFSACYRILLFQHIFIEKGVE